MSRAGRGRRWWVIVGVLCGFCFCLAAPVVTTAATDDEIEAARLKGVEFLKQQQNTDGSWDYANYTTGVTALCTLALVENGIPVNDPVVERGYRYVKRRAPNLENTYEISLAVLLLARVGDRLDKTTIRALGAKLLAGQNEGGGWGYKCPKADPSILTNLRRLERQDGQGDNSCTQFGVLGLWVASRYGVPIDDAMASVASRFLETQNEDGGWAYRPPGATEEAATGSSASMTCAGLFSLTVARATKIRTAQRSGTEATTETRGEKETLMSDPSYSRGFERVGTYAGGIRASSPKYFMWSVERLGVLLGLERLGRTDWFATGADALVKSQRPDGSWSEDKGQLSDVAFAILFLRKANLGSDISRLLEGEPEQQFAIVTRDPPARFDTLQAALAETKAGDIVRVDGNGPFKFSHDKIDKDLTIQAGYGYDPVFELEIGVNNLGLRYRPDRDVEAQHMVQITAGTLTLEGLKIQFDPPISPQPLPWKALYVNGGNLRLLNCSLSESNKRGMTPIVLAQPGSVAVRNTLFSGGKAAVEVVQNGQQSVSFENCVIYTPVVGKVAPGADPKAASDLLFKFYNSCVQVDEVISAAGASGKIQVEAVQSLFRADALGNTFLAAGGRPDGRSWRGERNVYNVKSWVGAGGRPAAISNIAGFTKLFGDAESSSGTQVIAWMASRRNGAFTHGVNPLDWDLNERSELSASSIRYGIASSTVGTGPAFSRYREDIRYNLWKRGISDPEAQLAAVGTDE